MNLLRSIAEQINEAMTNPQTAFAIQEHTVQMRDSFVERQELLKKAWMTLSFVVAAPFHISALCGVFTSREFLVGLYILMAVELGLVYVYFRIAESFPFVNMSQMIKATIDILDTLRRDPMPQTHVLVTNAMFGESEQMEWAEDLQDGITHESLHVGEDVYVLDNNRTTPIRQATLVFLFRSTDRTRNPFTNLPLQRITRYRVIQHRTRSRTPSHASSTSISDMD
jgi:hypothetical protein